MTAATDVLPRPNLLSILRIRNFTLLWSGQAISQTGDSLFSIAMMWLVLQITGSAAAMAAIPILAMLPRLAFQLIGGVSVDRYDRRLLMLLSDATRGLVIFGLAVLIATNQIQMWHIYILQIVFGFVSAFFYPAQNALVPNLVPKDTLVAANSLTGLTQQFTQIIGPALGGILIGIPAIGIAGVCFLNAASFGAGVLGLALMQIPPVATNGGNGKQSIWSDLRDGLSYLFRFRALVIILFLSMVLNFALAPVSVLLPLFVKNSLGQGPEVFGVLMAVFSCGMVAGSLVVGAWAPDKHRGMIVFLMTAFAGMLLVLLAMFPVLAFSFALTAIFGSLIAVVNIILNAMMQEMISDEYRGRVFGINMMISMGLMPVGMAVGGFLADATSAAAVFVMGGILTAAASLWGLFFRDVRNLE